MRKTNSRQIQRIKKQIVPILKKYKVKRAGIFGSYARGEQKRNSDIDIIIKPPKGMGFGFVGIQMELEKKLRKKVDMVTYKYLSPYLRDKILENEVRAI